MVYQGTQHSAKAFSDWQVFPCSPLSTYGTMAAGQTRFTVQFIPCLLYCLSIGLPLYMAASPWHTHAQHHRHVC